MEGAPPILDFSSFYGTDSAAKAVLVQQVKECCLHNGFFQIVGHRVPQDLQEGIFKCSKEFFNLPIEEKMKISKETNTYNRGYEPPYSQILEPGTHPDLKESLYLGADLPKTHPYSVQRKLNSGPNLWPSTLDPSSSSLPLSAFKKTTMEYYTAVFALAADVLKVLAMTLDLDPEYFHHGFMNDAVATMRLLHYPPQPAHSSTTLSRGIGAHTDFGALTLLLQDPTTPPCLQVLSTNPNNGTKTWHPVAPTRGAYVVNLGNLFMRWTNDRYISNVHRVINETGRERYSVPVFLSGNPDFLVECLPGCERVGEKGVGGDGKRYPGITVADAVLGGYRESYGRATKFKEEEEKGGRGEGQDVSKAAAVVAPALKTAVV
ncbi:MAG: hypothetical protein M1834_005357 [Cirrosporium novae-zelandiae]|nr:MAG: hypothetical protein M1834_005357 [Cirrosporium novae-zelandiae]